MARKRSRQPQPTESKPLPPPSSDAQRVDGVPTPASTPVTPPASAKSPEQLSPAASAAWAKPRHRRRTWPQRGVLIFNSLVSFSLLVAAAGVWYANHQLGGRKLVTISASPAVPPAPGVNDPGAASTLPGGVSPTAVTGSTAEGALPTVGPDTPAPAASRAKNFLLTASDSRKCIDPNSPYAGAFGDASDVGGQRADTIMLLRVDPDAGKAAILSFPRDLWVKIPGRGNSRINAALAEDPQKIIDTIGQNFYLGVDHYINVDFCAFKGMVDAVDGVPVPFEFAARDKNTGLNVTDPGCVNMRGDEALAYVRSRKYQYFDPAANKWKSDGTSDLGRITRQQDFLKRTLKKALNNGARNPLVANRLIDTALDYVTTDTDLTLDVMVELASVMRDFNPDTVKSFQIESSDMKVGDASVLRPNLNSPNMKAVLSVFRGQASILDIPAGLDPSLAETSTTIAVVTTVTTIATGGASTTAPRPSSPTTAPPATTTTVPLVAVAENTPGIAPPDDPTCV
jgi:LCP family protein required for cell wall assembly